jgi:hypothetical protein
VSESRHSVVSDQDARFESIRSTPSLGWPGFPTGPGSAAIEIGASRAGRPIHAYRIGEGATRVSIIAGCHADEPVGPRLMGRFAPYLQSLAEDDPLVERFEWWIIPHVNPDGAVLNESWQHPGAERYVFSEYLRGRVRELPGDDVEFGFPREPSDDGARPENAAAARWWESAKGPFDLHITLHGMAWAGGPWFLIEPGWVDRTETLRARCARAVSGLGYSLHDVERHGEKGFSRIGPGFATRPNSIAMRDHFLALDDPGTAARFYPSSMEFMGSLGGDPLTLVSEMPLFLLPGVGETIGPPDPEMERWRARIGGWTALPPDRSDQVETEASAAGLVAMPVSDQMRLQWSMICAALEAVTDLEE